MQFILQMSADATTRHSHASGLLKKGQQPCKNIRVTGILQIFTYSLRIKKSLNFVIFSLDFSSIFPVLLQLALFRLFKILPKTCLVTLYYRFRLALSLFFSFLGKIMAFFHYPVNLHFQVREIISIS